MRRSLPYVFSDPFLSLLFVSMADAFDDEDRLKRMSY